MKVHTLLHLPALYETIFPHVSLEIIYHFKFCTISCTHITFFWLQANQETYVFFFLQMLYVKNISILVSIHAFNFVYK